MAGGRTRDALMSEARHDASSAPGWPHLLKSFGEVDAHYPGAAAAGSSQQSALPRGMSCRSLAAIGAQLSAPPLMR